MFKFFHRILDSFKFILKFLYFLIIFPIRLVFRCIAKLFRFVTNRLRFSIAFKLNMMYAMIFILLFGIVYTLSIITYYIYEKEDLLSLHLLYTYPLPIIGVSFILFLIFGNMITKKMLNPLKTMTDTVKSINGNELNSRLNTSGAKDELKDLAYTFNSMMDRLQDFIERQNQFVSDASHELRTPIAVIQGYIELLDRWGKDDPKVLEESIQSIKQETSSMKNLVEQLLFLARSDKNTLKVDKQLISLSAIAKEVLKETSFIDDEHEFVAKIQEDIMIYGDYGLIKELIRIFVDNAIKYTPENGTITLSCIRTKNNCILSIKDTGIGMSKEHLPHIFDRFYRTEESRDKKSGGTGLGLAIAKWIIETHEADIYVESTPQKGTEFIIFFLVPNL